MKITLFAGGIVFTKDLWRWMAVLLSFIGLFGTVIGILETFSKLSTQKSAALSVVAPAISEALIATAVGIFVAIFAYSFHLLLKRKAYELGSVLESQAEVILSQYEGTSNVSLGR